MTGYTVHTGTTIEFSEGWDRIFQQAGQSAKRKPKKTVVKKTTAKKSSGKKGVKKTADSVAVKPKRK